MQYGLNRDQYEELFIFGASVWDVPSEERARILAQRYPCTTTEASVELRSRGYDTNPAMLDYLIKKEVVPAPEGDGGRNRRWTREDVDQAAAYLEKEGIYVPGTVARMFYNIDPAQDIRAQQECFAKNPDMAPDPSRLVMEIFPGAPGAGYYAEVSYRRMTPREEGELRLAVEPLKLAPRKPRKSKR